MKKLLKEYFIITIGIIIIILGFEFFFFPNNIACGGVSGLALIIHNILGTEPGIIMIICNIILFILAFVFIGGSFGIKSMYAAFGLSIILSIIEKNIKVMAITNNLVLATIFGSVLLAMGTAIMFTQNATTGGTSITAKILNKYCHIDFGKGLLISDSIVILLAIYTFGIELGLFGLLSVYLIGILVDKFIDGFNLCKQVMIFTEQEELVVNHITKDVKRGCTVFYGKGGYTQKQHCIILTILSRAQFIKLKKFMKIYDPNAFITVNETTEVLGKGFKNILE
ncbi:YitT family protein [Clostridium weizhouense]|uniref:YitT family protein n=1 Tax=Clostridium weizhouense TaxID=2859781 RepID=A0ABS7APB2_9CLOT|nr:YitT family protein [Clostridium weizhouense]MBW6410474.1 YitT family protein [Clostridium weizhouense]